MDIRMTGSSQPEKVTLSGVLNLYIYDLKELVLSPFQWGKREWTGFFLFLLSFAFCFFWADEPVRQFSQSYRDNAWISEFFKAVDLYGKGYFLFLSWIFLVAAGRYSQPRLLNYAHKMFEVFIFSGLLTNILKVLIGRWRPYGLHGNHYFTPFAFETPHVSFPSADVALAFSCSMIMASVYENRIWKAFWYILAVLTAFGRIYHDKHWSSDVLTSGVFTVYMSLWLLKRPGIRPVPGNNRS